MEEEILIRYLLEDLVRIVGRPQRLRNEHRVLERRAVQLRDLAPVAEPHPIRGPHDDIVFDLEVLHQDVEDTPRHVRLDLQERERAISQLLEPAIHRLEQVVGLVFLDHHVGVANDAEEMRPLEMSAGEELLDVAANHVFEEYERGAGGRREAIGQGHEPRQHPRHLDAGELRPAAVPDAHGEVHAQVRDVRERMARIEGERREDREDLRLEVLREPRIDGRGVVGRLEEVNAIGGQQRPQVPRPASRLLVHLRQCPRPDDRQLFFGGQPVERGLLDAGAEFLQDGGDPHHEELVEVRAGNRQELDALEERVRRVLGLREDPPVELEPAQLAIDVQRRGAEIRAIEVAEVDGRKTRLNGRLDVTAAAAPGAPPPRFAGISEEATAVAYQTGAIGTSEREQTPRMTTCEDSPWPSRRTFHHPNASKVCKIGVVSRSTHLA